jgi:hypothetical protein
MAKVWHAPQESGGGALPMQTLNNQKRLLLQKAGRAYTGENKRGMSPGEL